MQESSERISALMRQLSENSKRIKLKEQLALRITSGEFQFGDKFPGLHQICNEYDVSYVTANKAMKILVKEGYLLAKNGIGYFVCYVQPDIIPPRKVVNFITGLDSRSSVWHVIMDGKALFERAGWQVKLLTIPNGDLTSCVSEINSPDAFSVLFFTKLNWEIFTATFQHVAQRVIVIGHLSGNSDITSIISDEYETIRRCIAYFRGHGHTRTGLISFSPRKELDMLRIAAWRSLMLSNGADASDLNQMCFIFEEAQMRDQETILKSYSEWIRKNKNRIDSIIDPFSPELLAEACLNNGIRVPEEISIIRIARESQAESSFSIPTLHNNLYKHFEFAFSVIEERFHTGKKTPGAWIFCPPGEIIP